VCPVVHRRLGQMAFHVEVGLRDLVHRVGGSEVCGRDEAVRVGSGRVCFYDSPPKAKYSITQSLQYHPVSRFDQRRVPADRTDECK
jgi:hypothetical protein